MSRSTLLAALAIFACVAVAFSPSAGNGFVDWDDYHMLTRNEHIRSLSLQNLRWMATTSHLAQWQPLSWLAAAVQYRVFAGSAADMAAFGRGMHVTSIILHGLVGVLCFWIIRRLLAEIAAHGPGPLPARAELFVAFATLAFAVHPLRVEPVAWATSQPYVLALGFCLATVACHLHAARGRPTWWLPASWLCFGLSLLCKSIGVTLPLLLLLLDWYPLGRCGGATGWFTRATRRVWLEKAPHAILAAGGLAAAVWAKQYGSSAVSLAEHGLTARLAQACYGLVFYVYRTLVPVGLSPIYELRLPLDVTRPRYVAAMLTVALAAVALLFFRRRWRTITLAAAGYAILLAPALGLAQSGNQEVADRYSYLPCWLWSVPIAVGIWQTWPKPRGAGSRAAAAGAATFVVIALSAMTWRQCGVWRDTATLWTRAATVQPESSVAQNGYGYVLLQQGQLGDAETRLRRAIELMPTNEQAHVNLWRTLERQGQTEELIEAYRRTAREFPEKPHALTELGTLVLRRGQNAEAAACYREALARQPGYGPAHASLAGALYATGKYDEAITEARTALQLDRSLKQAHVNLALALRALGRADEAVQALQEAVRIDPQYARARQLLSEWSAAPARP